MLKHPTTKFYRRISQLLLILVLLLSCSFTTALLITRSGYQKKLQALSNRLEEETALQQQEDKPQDTPPREVESTAAAWEPEVLEYASLPWRTSGIVRIVFTLSVTSSPFSPSPRVTAPVL